MKRILCVIVSTCLMLSLSGVHAQSSARKAPKLIVDTMTTELGEIYSGQVKHFSFTIKNGGNDTLKIFSLKPSCGCTTVKAAKPFLLPGQTDNAAIDFNTAGMRGRVVKNITIESNDPRVPHRTISFISTVLSDFEILRYGPSVFLGNHTIGEPIKETLTLKNVAKYPIKVSGITSPTANLSVTAEKKNVGQSDSTHIQVNVTPDREGMITYELDMKTNSKNMPSFPIKVMVIGVKPKS
jgi:Protein of unknown function (DUF1573)